ENLYGNYFTSSIDGELASESTTTQAAAASSSPTILDSLPTTISKSGTGATSASGSYTIPAGGSNKIVLLLFLAGGDKTSSLTASINGQAMTVFGLGGGNQIYGTGAWIATTTSGSVNYTVSWSVGTEYDVTFVTIQDADQTNPIDATHSSGDA